MKTFLIIGAVLLILAAGGGLYYRSVFAGGVQEPAQPSQGSLWDFQIRNLAGEATDLSAYEGKVALVVNTASKCGFTPQYKGLQALYEKYRDRGLVVLGFPSNDFRQQEPGTADEIRKFCTVNYGVTFPLMAKVKVTGPEKCAVYKFLTAGGLKEPTWNFTKYLVGRDGKVIARYAPKAKPDDKGLLEAIEKALSTSSKPAG